MALKHLVPCSCGKPIVVTTSQAGETLTCECGVSIEAPSLRGLRELPILEDKDTRRGTWSFRQGVLTAGLIAVAGLLGVAGWLRAVQPAPPAAFDPEARETIVGKNLEVITPVDAWRMWEGAYKPLSQRGLEVFKSPTDKLLERQIAFSQTTQTRLLGVAGGLLVLLLVLFPILPK